MRNDEASRRRFLRAAVAGAALLPAALRAQVGAADSSHVADIDSSGYNSKIPYLQSGAGARHRKRKKDDPAPAKPPALKPGDTIALVAPASGVHASEVTTAIARLTDIGFKVKTGKYLTKGFGYLAGTDTQRADELMQYVRDPEVQCVMAVRGGYGVMRILPQVDFGDIARNPKIIIGYSDITALVNAVYQRAGLIAFHGPLGTSQFDKYTMDSFQRTLMTGAPAGAFGESDEFNGSVFSEQHAQSLNKGTAEGRLVGGNLSLVAALMGTPYEIDTEGRILFLEEIEEEPYRVDRMLTQLALGGKLSGCAGIALGRFSKCEARSATDGSYKLSLSLEQVIRGIVEPLKIPAVYGLAIGHIKSKLTVPVGAMARLDATARTLTIKESAVM